MLEIPIQAIPNQEFSFLIDANRYTIVLTTLGDDAMASSVSRNGIQLTTFDRLVSGQPLLAYPHLVAGIGNFSFVTNNDQVPYWTEFNVTQKLIYATVGEIQNV